MADDRAGHEAGARPGGAPWPAPRSSAELHAWIRKELGLLIPTSALIEGHAAPFDYVAHAFFEGAVPRADGDAARALPTIDARSPDCVVWANRGGGKTFLAALATMLDLVFKPTIEVRVLAGSFDQARHMHGHLRGMFDDPALADLIDGRVTERRLRLKNGSNVELLAQSQRSVRGTRVQKLRCDEVELFDADVWEAAQLVTRSKKCGAFWVPGTIECLSTMHVPHGLMWRLVRETEPRRDAPGPARRTLFKWGVVDVLDRCGDDHACETCPLGDVCAGKAKARDAAGQAPGHVSVDDAITLKSRVSSATWTAEMLSLQPSRRDSVLPEFDQSRHVAPASPSKPGEMLLCGMDFGMRAPTVVLWGVVTPGGGLRIIGERSVAGVVMERHVDAIRTGRPERGAAWAGSLGPPAWIGVDPAGNQRNDQTGTSNVLLLRRAGLKVRDTRLPIARGIELVRRRLDPAEGPATLSIDPACTTLIESLERYRYPPDRPESDQPIKDGSDHAVDALRYLIQNLDTARETKVGRH